MTIVTLGPEGTFSHELALARCKEDILLVRTIREIFEQVSKGHHRGIVPVENSEAGGVGATLTCFQEYPVYIIAELYHPIRHHLAGFTTEEPARLVYAHPQTHEQCNTFLDGGDYEVIHTRSNAESALRLLQDPHAMAILPEGAALRYNIPIVQRDIQNSTQNITRFALIAPEPLRPKVGMKSSILIDPRVDRVGLLHDLLEVFAKRGINLTRIESRPSRRGMGSYLFFIDFRISPRWKAAIKELKAMTQVKELGYYPAVEVGGWK